MIVGGNDCRYQKDGYCCLEGRAVITNAVSTPCCYYEKTVKPAVTPRSDDGQGSAATG